MNIASRCPSKLMRRYQFCETPPAGGVSRGRPRKSDVIDEADVIDAPRIPALLDASAASILTPGFGFCANSTTLVLPGICV